MSGYIEGPVKTFQASAALAAFRRVRFSTGKLAYCGALDTDCLGTLEEDALTADAYYSVRLRTAEGTVKMIASGVIAANAAVYAAANGKIADSGTVLVGVAINAAGADGDDIEVLCSPAAILGSIARTALTEDALAEYGIPLASLQATGTGAQLGASAGTPSGAMGLTIGTHGSATPKVVGEAASNNSKTNYSRFQFVLPAEYVTGGDIKLGVYCRTGGELAVSSTIDAECFLSDDEAGVTGSDLCATAAQSINTATWAEKLFTITGTSRVAGDVLDIELTGVANDTGGTANKAIEIGRVSMYLDIKG